MLRLICFVIATWSLSAQPKKIVLAGIAEPLSRELLKAASPDLKIVATTPEKLASEIADADAVITFRLTSQQVQAARKLRWIQNPFAGVEQLLSIPEIRDSGIVLTNCKILPGPNIADHAFAMLLALTRQLIRTIPDQSKMNFARDELPRIELNGRTALIVGVGGIGMQIAQRAKAFGMRVIGVDPKDMPLNMLVDKLVPPDRLDAVLPEADVIFVAAPHTKESEGMIGTRQFQRMKGGSYFIAVSRGKLYSMPGLVEALDSKRLAGAGVDVTDPEPLPKDHALWKFPNVVITPHIATQSDKLEARTVELIRENLKRFASGEPLLNVVDKRKGY